MWLRRLTGTLSDPGSNPGSVIFSKTKKLGNNRRGFGRKVGMPAVQVRQDCRRLAGLAGWGLLLVQQRARLGNLASSSRVGRGC